MNTGLLCELPEIFRVDRYILADFDSVCGTLDILPALTGEDSPKGSARLRVSSVVKYAFASHVEGHRIR